MPVRRVRPILGLLFERGECWQWVGLRNMFANRKKFVKVRLIQHWHRLPKKAILGQPKKGLNWTEFHKEKI